MEKGKYPGKMIVFEGIDGSGKATQTKLLIARLKQNGYKVATIDFPRHGHQGAYFVDKYLQDKYARRLLNAWRVSVFYACDRYDASFEIRKWLEQGKIVIVDRYVASNMGHQGGKISDKKKRKEFIEWLDDLEYKFFGLPRPDINIFLKSFPRISQKLSANTTDKDKLSKKKAYLGNKKKDLHEKDIQHLEHALASYLEVAKMYPKDFAVVDCFEENILLPAEVIHGRIWRTLKQRVGIIEKVKNDNSDCEKTHIFGEKE
jgi:dTMP kinase